MHTVVFGANGERARELAEPLYAEGYEPELRIVADGKVTDADVEATQRATIVFFDLAIGAPIIAGLCRRISTTADLVPPLLAILGEPAESDADQLIAGGANMYFAGTPETLALRTRFLRKAVAGRAMFAKTLADLRAAEQRNRAIEQEHQKILDHAPNPVFVHRDGRLVWTNAHGAALLGFPSPAAASGVPIMPLVPASSRPMIEQRLRDRALGKHDAPFEQTLVLPTGEEKTLFVVGLPTMFEGKPAGIAFVRDLTEQRRLETQLMAAERMASLGRLAASVGHEINNPLTYVLGNLELAARAVRNGRSGPDVAEMLDAALAGADRVRRIVDDLRVFSQRNAESITPVDLRSVVDACVRMTFGELRDRAKIIESLDGLPPVLANEPRLAQVITNLLLNAAQALPDGAADKNTVTLAARTDGDMVELRIEDTGKGIAPEHLAHVFEPFATTKTETGSGIGLAICRMLLAAQNGTISIASEVGKGTCVTLRIPLAHRRETSTAAVDLKPSATARRVLLVDDDPNVAAVLSMNLEPHDVTLAETGRDALSRLEAGERFDVIVCDLMMPDLSGVDVHERIRAQYPGLEHRIVFMTGGAFTPRASDFLATVPNVCLQKPFEIDRLITEIERVATQ